MSLWRRIVSEAHRRSLWQVMSIYLVGSWVGFQVVLDLVEGIGLPEWLPGAAAVLFVIGLPIVLATAFVQEGGPTTAARDLDPALFPDAAQSGATAPAGRLRRLLTWRRALSAGVTAFALLTLSVGGLLGMRAVGAGPWGSLLAAERIEENDRVLIADFDARGTDSTLAAVVSEAFRIDFARSTLVRAVTASEIRQVLRRMGRDDSPRIDAELAHQIAVRDGISTYVTGDITAAGSAYVLSARLISTATGEVLVALRERAAGDEAVIDAVDQLSRQLRRRTGESLRTVQRAEALAKVTTSSLEALRLHTQARRASNWDGDPERARELHERAIQLDTAFAAAHRALAVYYNNRGDRDRAIVFTETALRHRDRMTEFEHAVTQGTLHLSRAEYADAARALERALQADPRDASTMNNLGLVYSAMGDHVRAQDYYRRSALADTTRFFAFTNLGEHLALTGRLDEAEENLRRAVRLAPQSGWPVVSLALLPFAAGNYAEAESRLKALLADPANGRSIQERAAERLYYLLMLQGRVNEAAALMASAIQSGALDGDEAVYALVDSAWIGAFVLGRSEPRLLARLRASAASVTTDQVLADIAATCAWLGDAACARELIGRLGAKAELKPWSPGQVRVALAGLARADGDRERALRILREIRETGCFVCPLPLIGLLQQELNQPDSAAATYERYIASTELERIWTDYELVPIHERLARHYEERGDADAARKHYLRVTEIWRDADPVLQPRVAAARQRLARLQPDR